MGISHLINYVWRCHLPHAGGKSARLAGALAGFGPTDVIQPVFRQIAQAEHRKRRIVAQTVENMGGNPDIEVGVRWDFSGIDGFRHIYDPTSPPFRLYSGRCLNIRKVESS
ncbi:hypothetical protein [Pandoraea sputorum]|uniref:hypothetical protein n=1 Tax=Pandoraea sputorum TaxID=93222 RepID=UPI001240F2AC|nr:hypothetical protein [Pandoraea sputorum]